MARTEQGNIVIYGAGKYAKALCQRYRIADRVEDIAYIVVTEQSDAESELDGIPVYSFDEKKNDLSDKTVIIAMAPNASSEVEKKVKKYKAKEVLCMSRCEYVGLKEDCIEICKELPIVRNKVVFFCFEGRGYTCNCKYLAEYLRMTKKYNLVWILRDDLDVSTQGIPSDIRIIKPSTIEYYKEVCTAGFIVTNNTNGLGVGKRKEQYMINTWHGIGPFKTVGIDVKFNKERAEFEKNYAFSHSKCDLKIAASDDCVNMYRQSMLYKGEILKCGYPRNDLFFNDNDIRAKVRLQFNINDDQLVVLYAPTFRENLNDYRESFDYYDIDIDKLIDSLHKKYGKEVVFMYRFHQHLLDFDECKYYYTNGINVSDYLDSQELLLASDVLVTDYSSIMWDFSLMKKPVFLYVKDAKEYVDYRGFYTEPENWPYPQAKSSEELCEVISEFDNNSYLDRLDKFFYEYGTFDDGHAAERIETKMQDVMDHPEKYGKEAEQVDDYRDIYYRRCIMPKVSVVVPVYNTQDYLKECLDSIINQSFKEIEIVCIDDGSTDESPSILDEYEKTDPRIRVIHKKNAGYGAAINQGIKLARGKYVGIVESDDFIARNMYERLYTAAIENSLDMIKAECFYCWDSINYRVPGHVNKTEPFYNQVLTEENRDVFFSFFMNTWSGIYKRSFLMSHGIEHHETKGASFQDNGFWMQTMYHARRAMWLKDKLYYYRQDNENASVMGDGKVFEMPDEYEWVEDRLRTQGIDEDNMKYCYYYHLFRNKGNMLRISDEGKRKFASRITADFEKHGHVIRELVDVVDSKKIKNKLFREWAFRKLFEQKDLLGWYEQLMADPDKRIDGIIDTKKEIIGRIESTKHVYIVGIIAPGQRVKRILIRNGLNERISAFITPDMIRFSQIGDTPVRNINDPCVSFDNALVIMGAWKESEEYSKYSGLLMSAGIDKWVDCEELIDNFYWLT